MSPPQPRLRRCLLAAAALLLVGLALACSRPQPSASPSAAAEAEGPPAAAEQPSGQPAPSVSAPGIRLAFGGDVMLARLVNAALQARGPRYVWGNVLPLLRSADLTLVNLECVIATSGKKFVPRRVFYFRAAPVALDALRLADIDYVSMANNHALDYQAPALLETIRRLDAAGIAHAGAGRNLKEASEYALLEAKGVKVGVVSFADHFDLYAATDRRPGTNVIAIETRGPDFARVERALQKVRAAGATVVVFSIHWGPNMRARPTSHFVRFAHAVIDAGADIFHGHSAHIFQGVELYQGKPILFDTGDLVDDYYVDEELRNDQQLLFFVQGSGERGWSIELVPLLIDEMQVNLARGNDFVEIFRRLRRLSGPMGIRVERAGDRLVARPKQ